MAAEPTAGSPAEVSEARQRGWAISPLVLGFGAAVGVGITYLLFRATVAAKDMLILLGVALFFAVGLDPVVRALQRIGIRRSMAVALVFIGIAGVATAFGFLVVPPLVDQVTTFVHKVPGYLDDLQKNRRVNDLDQHVHLIDKMRSYVKSGQLVNLLAGNALSAGTAVASTIFDGVTILILTLYFMAYLDSITSFGYRLIPRSRRERAEVVGGKITAQLGEYVAGNLLVALIAGVITLLWLEAIGAPLPIALALVVALLDVIPLVGAAVAAIVVSTVVLISSIGAGIATIVFLIVYQLAENHILVPRLFRTRVRINPAATIIGALIGATLLGIYGFLLSIPLVASADLLIREIVIPRQRSR
ncbi:MAG: AI-2E family transporter [Actinobacteria bacterium]|nr:AI-2E family transporter [Actinomycetota bacterium]